MEWIGQLDQSLIFLVREYLSSPVLDGIMLFFTTMGDGGLLWIAMGLGLLFFPKTRRIGLVLLIALFFTHLIGSVLLKNLFARPRPCVTFPDIPLLIPRPSGFSFPSGHASSSFAGAAVLFFAAGKKAGIPAFTVALLIAFSRVYLFVHYPTDILAGALLGLFWGWFWVRALDWARPTEVQTEKKQIDSNSLE